ncbi:MAG: polysaccharide biosynthesis/export family protein [Lentimicrobiaceae bacterium]|nr:polysaccharide biosynthesis/export family protein [Lentimicrobiaceae bacterium]
MKRKSFPEKFLKQIFYLCIVTLVFTSCISQKKVRYLQEQSKEINTSGQEFVQEKILSYKVKAGDNLYVRVTSLDPKTYTFFNGEASTTYSSGYYMSSESSVYFSSYVVNDSGYIDFPIIGKIKIGGQTIEQVKSTIQSEVDEYLMQTNVIVKLANFKITVLGEVQRPGKFLIYQDYINIFEAIGLAGDLKTFAQRNKIILVRETEKGSKVFNVDITKKNVLESEYYYLKPNDIVYVQPMNSKTWTFESFPYAVVLSTLTTTLLILQYFK